LLLFVIVRAVGCGLLLKVFFLLVGGGGGGGGGERLKSLFIGRFERSYICCYDACA